MDNKLADLIREIKQLKS